MVGDTQMKREILVSGYKLGDTQVMGGGGVTHR